MKEEKRKLEDQIQQDAIKIKEYNVSKVLLKSIYNTVQTKIARFLFFKKKKELLTYLFI